ncbi:von Willebrand factor A domain-containing protein 5A-like isoform X2 [Sardina pilchardus]|uniref:von Willebrand factor A domain-containing protein 5A-like isoform X2 n=1 Tax=Sardina pilchardus TaxID=27697 RepID=UPI002E15B9D7
MEYSCGLVTKNKKPVPLKSVEVDVHVKGHVATVTSTLRYVNGEERPLEAVFVFPLPGESAVCHLSAKIGDTEVVAKLQDKQKAREKYDDALSSGHQAFLLEESAQSPDVFQLNVGSLPPGESAAITLVYISELAMQADDALRFCLPAVLNPRYTPQGERPWGSTEPFGCYMDRSQMATVTSVPAGTVPYTLALSAQLSSPQSISKVESNCHLEPLAYLNPDKTQATVSLSPGHLFDRDVELLLYYQDAHKPTAIVEAGLDSAEPGSLMGDPVVMISIYPEFPAAATSSLATCGEFIFVVDRSGSMDCKMHSGKDAKMRIESAKDTLLLLLKSLPMGCYFNIYSFGSHHDHFFPKSVKYNQKTMDDALEKVKGMRADMGGTEILQPLKHIYSQPCIPSHPRQLFIFTDGEVGNTKEVLDLVKKNLHSHRCFSFGIGEGASTALITGLAKEGSGHAQFITGTDRMQPKVMQSLRFALQPVVKNISVKWNLSDGFTGALQIKNTVHNRISFFQKLGNVKAFFQRRKRTQEPGQSGGDGLNPLSVIPLSPPITVLFQGQRALLYAQLNGVNSEHSEGSVTIQYNLKEDLIEEQLNFCLKPTQHTGLTLHRLGARALIRSLETEERAAGPEAKALREKLLQLSLQSGVSCTHTAFIAIHKGSGQTVQGPLLHRPVPTPGTFFGACSLPIPRGGMAPVAASLAMSPESDDDDYENIRNSGEHDYIVCIPNVEQLKCTQTKTSSGCHECSDDNDYLNWKDAVVDSDSDEDCAYVNEIDVNCLKDGKLNGCSGDDDYENCHSHCEERDNIDCVPNDERFNGCSHPDLDSDEDCDEQSYVNCEQFKSNVIKVPQTCEDPYLELISLQKADGSWEMESALAKILGRTYEKAYQLMPIGANRSVSATVLALIWLYGFCLEARDEWQFVAMKAASWIQAQKVDCVSQCVQAGNALLGCQLQQETLGL